VETQYAAQKSVKESERKGKSESKGFTFQVNLYFIFSSSSHFSTFWALKDWVLILSLEESQLATSGSRTTEVQVESKSRIGREI
jgi:hypothetical protein